MKKSAPILYLIDISSYIYRAFHAIRSLTDSKGRPTNAVFGVTSMLLKVLREQQPTHLALVFDAKGPTFRHRLYSEYKAHRPGMPEELVGQLPYIQRLIKALQLPALEAPGYEADDLICTLTHRARAQGFQVEIVSGDKDLLPLVQEGVTVWDPMKEIRYDTAAVQEKFGLAPRELLEMRSLAGDSSDNIPGVPGVGEKTAVKLITQFHSLENLLLHLDELKEKKLRARLEEYQEQARLSWELSRLDSQVPLPVQPEDLQPGTPDRPSLRRLFAELEFTKFSKELGTEEHGTVFKTITAVPEFNEVMAAISAAGQVSIFCLTDGRHPMLAEIAGLGLAWQEGGGAYLPWQNSIPTTKIWEALEPIWSDAQITKIGGDLKNVFLVGTRFDKGLAGLRGDILLASYLLNPARFEQNLENIALHYLGLNLLGLRELAGRPLNSMELPLALATTYAAGRAEAALRLWPRLQEELEKEGLLPLYKELELPLLTVLGKMEARGVLVDTEFLKKFGQELEGDLNRLEQEIYLLAGETFLIQSPQQLAHILFDKLQLPTQKKTKGKTRYSTDNEVLTFLTGIHPIAEKVIAYRTLGKLKATYVDALLNLINPVTSRIHTTLVQSVAATGRLASCDPNLQNIPVRGEAGSQLRQAFVAPQGWVLLSGDYSQIELRLLAHLSEDPILLTAFADGEDIHRQTAAEVFGIHPELVSKEMRRQAKVINFGIIYGMSAYGLAKQLGVGQRLAQEFINRYFARHVGVQNYFEKTLAQVRQQGWVGTLWGRRRQTPLINSGNRNIRQEAERSALNTPLQGSAADLIKQAMLAVETALRQENLQGALILQLHDELLLEAPEAEITATARLLRRRMEKVVQLKVPLIVDLQVGKNWGEMKVWTGD